MPSNLSSSRKYAGRRRTVPGGVSSGNFRPMASWNTATRGPVTAASNAGSWAPTAGENNSGQTSAVPAGTGGGAPSQAA
jgi:hypothetical protein